MSYSLDCLRSPGYLYRDRCEPNDVAKFRLPRPVMRPSSELFAFNWYELPEKVQDKIFEHIRKKYDTENKKDILGIFKILVARDYYAPLGYVKAVTKSNSKNSWDEYSFDEKTFSFVREVISASSDSKYFLLKKPITANDSDWESDDGKYITMEDAHTHSYSCDSDKCRYKSLVKAKQEIQELNRSTVLYHICHTWHNSTKENASAISILSRLKGLDLTKPGNTVLIKKSEWLASPRDIYEYSMREDYDLVKIAKKYNLSSETDHQFIEWIKNECSDKAKKSKLTAETAKNVHNRFSYPYMSRGNVVEFYHGTDLDIKSLTVGTIIAEGKNRWIVVHNGGCDPEDEACIIAKEGTSIDSFGVLNTENIRYLCDSYDIESCWDALFDVNRVGKRKKFLKNAEVVSK